MSGPQCCENPPTLSSSSGVGAVTEIAGLKSYVSGPSDSKLAILLISDIFGYEAPNLRKLADKVAAAGYYVVVPDFLYGDPYDPSNAEKPVPVWIKSHGPVTYFMARCKESLCHRHFGTSSQNRAILDAYFRLARSMYPFMWINVLCFDDHCCLPCQDKGVEDAKQVIAALRGKGISSIGAAGFCWGAKVVVQLAKSDDIQAGVLLHPSFVTVDDIKEVIKPISILGAENDHLTLPELVKQFEATLSSKPEIFRWISSSKSFPEFPTGGQLGTKLKTKMLSNLLKKLIRTC